MAENETPKPGNPATPNTADDNSDSKGTSADVATKRSAQVITKLETRLSVLEDDHGRLKAENASLRQITDALAKTPSKTQAGKSVLTEVCEMLFGAPKPPAA